MGSETALTVFKWVITILVAGFIAQFGKKTADYFIEKFKQVKDKRGITPEHAGMPGPDGSARTGTTAAAESGGRISDKQLKKREKAGIKLEKKGG